ncbi:hypothetical protein AURDEDRAFT_176168 [Auricularia subglabra TFB-10046 SS5]|uniref:Uncharacterized protein n=1 Tax=Auricularia subglabra (strain TFB-10046 / SS5) TaxID=717982 RepID=J0CW67_AURST|nr:hypothetical protein AURDEDRAFT_176168 [Auricularia subglabra TFB-10046 SS5]
MRLTGAKSVQIAAAALFIYDHLTTFAAEIALVGIVLYHQFFSNANIDCRVTYTYSICSLVLGILVADVILVLRTWAVWNTQRSILVLLIALFAALSAASAYIAADFLRGLTFHPVAELTPPVAEVLGRHVCLAAAGSNRLAILWTCIAVFELVIFISTAAKAIGHLQEHKSGPISSLYRDGRLFFVCIFATNAVVIYTSPTYAPLLGMLQCTLHSVLGCRLILHIRGAALKTKDPTLTSIHVSSAAIE